MNSNEIERIVEDQRLFFASRKTSSISFRKQHLKALRTEISQREQDIYDALYKDFHKSKFETYLSEIGIVLAELDLMISNLSKWARPKKVRASLLNFPSTDRIYSEPYGCTLIIAPWNYPFQLAISPLIGAIAAGNTAIIKPSELTPYTSALLSNIISKVFDPAHVSVIKGGKDVAQSLLEKRWDYIFFTGSVNVGRIVAKAAAEHLTPVTLELGGKNPCIIDETANMALTAKRIAWGKFLNAGQTCIAPDYILIKKEVKEKFIDHLRITIEKAYTKNPEKSDDYPRIINDRNFERLTSMLDKETIAYGGEMNKSNLYLAPTILDEPSIDSPIMKEEIFGPILPVLIYNDLEDLKKIIYKYEKPLSLYLFSNRKSFISQIQKLFSFGGGAINDTLVQFANQKLPFGGVGNSGIGSYHGKSTFDTFSHKKSISKKGNWIDPPFRYAPYEGKLGIIKKLLKYFG